MSLKKYLPPQREDTVATQIKVPRSLRDAVDDAREEDGLTLHEIVIAGLKMYLEERRDSRKR